MLDMSNLSDADARIVDAYQAGGTRQSVAEKVGLSIHTLSDALVRLRQDGVDVPRLKRPKEKRKEKDLTVRQRAILNGYRDGLSPADIAARLNIRVNSVTSAASSMRSAGINMPMAKNKAGTSVSANDDEILRVQALFARGVRAEEIARQLGRSLSFVHNAKYGAGLRHNASVIDMMLAKEPPEFHAWLKRQLSGEVSIEHLAALALIDAFHDDQDGAAHA